MAKNNPAKGKTNLGPSKQGAPGSGQGPEVDYARKTQDTSQWTQADWQKNYFEFYNKPSSPKPVEWGGRRDDSGSQGQAQPQQYVVKRGDSWVRIAGQVYGDQRMFGELIRANSKLASGMLQPGDVLRLPPKKDRPFDPQGL